MEVNASVNARPNNEKPRWRGRAAVRLAEFPATMGDIILP